MASILLKNISVDGQPKDILIDSGLIRSVTPAGGPCPDLCGDVEICDCTGKAAVPGFVNAHTHAGMTIMRGVGEDMVFHDWISHIWRIEEQLTEEFVYWSTKVACIEMIRTGTTTFNDMYWHHRAALRAAREMGLRIAGGYVMLDQWDAEQTRRNIAECEAAYEEDKTLYDGASSIYVPSFHAVYSVSEDLMKWTSDFARKGGHRLHIHLCETRKEVEDCKTAHGGMTPVEYLDSLGILGPEVIAAHSLWLSDNDVRLLGKNHVNCVHCINSNLKLSSGYRFLYNELRDAGANVCLGTDSTCSSNNLDMLEAMKTSTEVQKAWRDDPTAMPLDELLAAATVNGARALGLDAGIIREGTVADILIVDTSGSFFLSPGSFKANLVYSAHSDCIESVIASGRFVMRNREIEGEKEILARAREVLGKLIL